MSQNQKLFFPEMFKIVVVYTKVFWIQKMWNFGFIIMLVFFPLESFVIHKPTKTKNPYILYS